MQNNYCKYYSISIGYNLKYKLFFIKKIIMIVKDNFFLKLLLFIITATLITPPFNYWIKVFFFSLAVVAIFSSKIDTENIKKKKNTNSIYNINLH